MDFVRRMLRTVRRNQQWLMLGAGTVAVAMLSVRLAKKYALDWQNSQLRLLLEEKDREKRYQTANAFTTHLMNKHAVAYRKAILAHFRERKEALAAAKSSLTKLEYLNVVKNNLLLDVMLYTHASVLYVLVFKVWHFVYEGNCRAASTRTAAGAAAAAVSADFREKFYTSAFSLLVKSVRHLNECLDKDFEKVVRDLNIYRALTLKEIDIQLTSYHEKFLETYKPFSYFNALFAEKFAEELFDERSPTARAILTEVRDLLKCNEMLNVYNCLVRRADVVLMDELYKAQLNSHEITNNSNSLTQLNNKKGNFVTFLPKIDAALKDKLFLNAIITQTLNHKNLQTMQKNVFQSYCEN